MLCCHCFFRTQDVEGFVSGQEASRSDEVELCRDSEVRDALVGRQPEPVAADGLVHCWSVVSFI